MFLFKLKHWQSFLLIFILPFILRYLLHQLLLLTGFSSSAILSTVTDALPAIFPVLWLWLVSLYLHGRLPASIRISFVYVHLGALYFTLYTFVLVYTLGIAQQSITGGTLPLGMLALLLPMHLFATFCYLYLVYFAARCIVSVEKQRIVDATEYLLPLVQVLFLPVGIWFLQPRLKKLFSELAIH